MISKLISRFLALLIPSVTAFAFFDGEAGAAGDGGTGDGSGGTGDAPPPKTGDQPPAPPAGETDREKGLRLELERVRRANAKRDEDDAKKRGDFEKLAADREGERDAANAKATRIARRAAFVSIAASLTSDADAAYKLAAADNVLDDVEVDDEGSVTKGDVKKIVEELLKKYPFLATSGQGGDTRSRAGAGAGGTGNGAAENNGAPNPAKMSAQEQIRYGIEHWKPDQRRD